MAGSFSTAAAPGIARSEAASASLNDGRAYIAGGWSDDGTTVLASAQIYDATTNTWTSACDLPAPRTGAVAVTEANGHVLIFAGVAETGELAATVFEFDPGTNTCSSVGVLNRARRYFTATLLNDGTVLITGGVDTSYASQADAEVYDPVTNTSTVVGDMSIARQNQTATLLPNGNVLIAGGYDASGIPTADLDLYDPMSQTFINAGQMLSARALQAAALLPSGDVLFAGGVDATNKVQASAELFDPSSGTASSLPDLGTERRAAAVAVLPTGAVLIAGGQDRNYVPLSSAETFNPVSQDFAASGNMSTARGWGTSATVLGDGRVLISGGTDVNYHELDSADLYDEASATPPEVQIKSTPRGSLTATATQISYDETGPVISTSCTIDGTPISCSDQSASVSGLVLGTHTFVVTVSSGSDSASDSATWTVVAKDLRGDTFSPAGDMPIARADGMQIPLPDGTVLIAGGTSPTGVIVDPSGSSYVADHMVNDNDAGSFYGGVALDNGDVLFTGFVGSGGASAEIFDFSAKKFVAVGDPIVNGGTPIKLADGRVLFVGGVKPTPATGCIFLSAVQIYDPATQTFSSVPDLGTPRWYPQLFLKTDGRVAIRGGQPPFSCGNYGNDETFDPNTERITSGGNTVPFAASTPMLLPTGSVLQFKNDKSFLVTTLLSQSLGSSDTASYLYQGERFWSLWSELDYSALKLDDGRALITGAAQTFRTDNGAWTCGNGPCITKGAAIYDPFRARTQMVGDMSIARGGQTSSHLPDGTVLVAGGYGADGNPQASMEIFTPATAPDVNITDAPSGTVPDTSATVSYEVTGAPAVSHGCTIDEQPVACDLTSATVENLAPGDHTFQVSATSADNETATDSADWNVAQATPQRTLTVSLVGSGSGTVTGTGISCPSTCSASYDDGTTVDLSATPEPNSVFTGWSGGGCSGTAACQVVLNADTTVTATFAPVQHQLTITLDGNGSGSGTVTGPSISCPDTCSASYDEGTIVDLTATPDPNSEFIGWTGGGCSGTGTCQVVLGADTTVIATFDLVPPPPPVQHELTVTLDGNGSGSVSGSGVSCPQDCSLSFDEGTIVQLTAEAADGSTFSGWSGACTGSYSVCSLTMDGDMQVAAAFDVAPPPPVQPSLSVSLSGSGSGSVTGSGISCPSTCSSLTDLDSQVSLTAVAAPGSVFSGWSGDCSGSGSVCSLTMDADKDVGAVFDVLPPPPPVQYELSATVSGSGSISGSDIACPGNCANSYDENAVVDLTATPATGWTFSGWSGACTGTSPVCSVTMSQARSVQATFTEQSIVTPITPVPISPDPTTPTDPITGPASPTPDYSQCTLRKARARVFIYGDGSQAHPNGIRLVIRYRTRAKAKVIVGYTLKGNKGKLNLGKAVGKFKKKGLYRRARRLTKQQMIKVRAKGVHLLVKLRIPGEPPYCARAYSRHLTVKRVIHQQTIFFQSDSDFIGQKKHRRN